MTDGEGQNGCGAQAVEHICFNAVTVKHKRGFAGKFGRHMAAIVRDGDGRVFIVSPDGVASDKARKMIDNITRDIEVGDVFLGKVVRIMQFGAFVELLPGKDGLVHISKLDNRRVEKVEDVVSIGDEILVKVVEIDKQGKINLTRKGLLPDDASNVRSSN